MEVHNNFSPLAFRKKESKATYEKWYAFGKNYAIPASANTLTPFQFTELNIPVFEPNTIEVEVINEETGEPKKTGVYVSFDVMPEHGGVLYVSPGKNSFREALPQGTYRARFSIGDEVYISTPFCVIPGIETSSKYLLIEYWNDEKIAYPGGFITTGANNEFKYQMYVPATICKPKYEFEEELTKRAGYKFLELQTSTKVYAFTFVAPEFICDAMRLIRLSDYIRISHDGEYYNALNFEFDVDWQEQLYLAAVDCQFETDSIIQKLPSFNRRDKASFYNALLANIDTPIMFSPDTVGLYYKEYRETEPVVKGKLIRELSPIDLIDENTTIAVDLGTGEARKFNLYRMLQDYISKAHEDATDFLLHLRGGATFGEGITGSAASINAVGDAEVQGLNARVTKVKSLDSEDYVTVNKTAFTVNKQGDTALNALNARGVSRLQQDVYTGNDTGKITKEGQLQYLSAIIQQFLSSPTFVSGFLGEGFKIWVENGNWHIECDNLTVRQTMNIFELLIQKIRSVNGALVVSQSNGKLSEVKEVGEQYKLTTGEEFPTFQEGDLVRCQTFAGYQGSGLTFDFTQFAKFDYSGSSFDSSLVDVTPDSISFNLNDTGNSGFAFYKMQPSSETPIEIPSFILILEGAYPGMMAVATGLDSNDSPVESAGVLLKNGENLIPAITLSQGIHNFAITVVGDSGHGTGKVTVKQKRADGSAPSNNFVKFYWVEVKSVDGTSFFVDKSEFNGVVPAVGDEVVQMGNTKNPERQALIYITAQESGHPYIEILNGVKTKSLSGTNRTRLGDLSNIQDSAFPEGQQPSGSGLYCDNAFLRGIFLLRNGKSVEDEVNQAKQDAANAATEAERAQQTAQEAKDRLNKWADDGLISPPEKPALIDEGKRIQAEHLSILADASKYGISATVYTQAYNDYLGQLQYHSAPTPENIVVLAGLAESQTTYYNQRNMILSAIADAAKAYVDEADKRLKEYLDTEITAIPGKIELAVRSSKIADTNLLKGSYIELKNNDYVFGAYQYDVPVINGKEYTLTVCYTLSENNTHISVYSDAGSNLLSKFDTKGNMIIESKKVTMAGYNPNAKLYFFQIPQGAYGSKVHWAVLTDGNLGVTSWIPAASEKNVGLKNLCSFKRITDAGFTYAKNYEDSGNWYINPSLLHSETNLANKDMFGLTYNPNKKYYLFVDYANRTETETDKAGTYFLIKYTDETEERVCYVYPNDIKRNYIITQKPISKIVGSYNNNYGVTIRVGLYETNFPVSWSPAPEDQLYQSIKYTDTQILAVDGKIELSVKTKVENLGIGANNLYSYTSSPLNQMNSEPMTITRLISEHGFHFVGAKDGQSFVRIPNVIPPIPGKYTVSGWIKGSQNTPVGFILDVCDSDRYVVKSNAQNTWSYFKHTFDVTRNTEDQKDVYHFVDIENIDWAYIWVKDFKVEAGEIATAWSPNFQDAVYKGAEYTNSQIDIVEKKIELKVSSTTYEEGISNAQRIARYLSTGRMLPEHSDVCFSKGLNNIKVYNNAVTEGVKIFRSSIAGVPNNTGYSCTINTTLSRGDTAPGAGGFYFNNQARYGAMFLYKLVAAIPKGRILEFATNAIGDGSTREWLTSHVGTGKWEEYYYLVKCGTSGDLSGSGFFFIADKANVEWHLAYATVYDVFGDNSQINKTTYETKITQLESSISLKASQTDLDNTTERVRQAEIKLDSTSVKLGVVEGTANSANTAAGNAQNTANAANSLASTANNKAEAADGRVTATQNGLVETGINITSRKIVLKSDNVLFQNNAGQQTAALNANGRLTANVIEAGEVVANGFAAQRITTGNLTVTDGAVIAGMTISGGVLTGKNINITDGAKVGSFTISSGIFSAQEVPAGIQMTLAGNASTFDSSGVRVENNSGSYALTTTGKGKIFLTGSDFWVQCKDVDFMGAQTWKAPGVFYACTILANGAIGKTWGNPDFHITRVTKNSTGRYTVNTTGSNGDYFVMITAYDPSSWLSTTVEPYSEGQFTYKVFDVNNGMRDGGVIIYFCGMVR